MNIILLNTLVISKNTITFAPPMKQKRSYTNMAIISETSKNISGSRAIFPLERASLPATYKNVSGSRASFYGERASLPSFSATVSGGLASCRV
jgi:hypothetical protein